MTRDSLFLNYNGLIIIVRKIDEKYVPNWSTGIAIEYRNDNNILPDQNIRKAITDFLTFFLGTQLMLIGTTNINSDNQAISGMCLTPSESNIIKNSETGIYPPISLIQNIHKPKNENQLNKILYRFMFIYNLYDLDDVIWKLNLGKVETLGVDLPILHSGLEVLAENHLKIRKCLKKYTRKGNIQKEHNA